MNSPTHLSLIVAWMNFALVGINWRHFHPTHTHFKSLLQTRSKTRHSLLTELSNLHFSAKLHCWALQHIWKKECHRCELWQFDEIRKLNLNKVQLHNKNSTKILVKTSRFLSFLWYISNKSLNFRAKILVVMVLLIFHD